MNSSVKGTIHNHRQATVLSVVVTMLFAVSMPLRAARPDGLLSKKELKPLIANAKTPEDHQKLARHFSVKADRLEAESREHLLGFARPRRPQLQKVDVGRLVESVANLARPAAERSGVALKTEIAKGMACHRVRC